MTRMAEVRNINGRLINATLPCGIAFRGGLAIVGTERHVLEAFRLEGVSVRVLDPYVDHIPAWLNQLGHTRPLKARVEVPEDRLLVYDEGVGYSMLTDGLTVDEQYPTDPEPDPEPPAPTLNLTGWTPPPAATVPTPPLDLEAPARPASRRKKKDESGS